MSVYVFENMTRSIILFCVLLICANTYAQPDHSIYRKYSLEYINELIEKTEDDDTLAAAYYHRSRKQFLIDNDLCIASFEEALPKIEALGQDSVFHAANLFYVLPLVNGAQYEKAYQRLQLSRQYYEERKDLFRLASVYITEGFLQRELLNYQSAVGLFKKALAIYEEADFENVHYGINNVNNRIGISYSLLGLNEEAASYFEKVRSYSKANNVTYFNRSASRNLASCLIELGQKEEAIPLIKEVIEIRKKSSSTSSKRAINLDYATIAGLDGQIQDAIKFRDSALFYAERLNNHSFLVSDYFELSQWYLKSGNLKKERSLLLKAVEKGEEFALIGQKPKIYKALGDNFMKTDNVAMAAGYYQKYSLLQDSIRNEEKVKELQRIVARTSIDKFNEELEKAKAKSALEEVQIKKEKQRNRFLLLFSTCALGLLLFLYRNNRAKQVQKDQLSIQKNEIESNLKDKEILLREIHHRVKNNLQVVSSMLNLNLRYVKDEGAKDILLESRNRVKSMALIHQKLYQEEDLRGVQLKDYLTALTNHLKHSYRKSSKDIAVTLAVEEINLDVDTMIPLGLMVNEIFSNCMKHAFEGRKKGLITIDAKLIDEQLCISILDNGVGYLEEELRTEQSSFGMTLIESLSEKLKSKVEYKNENGTKVTLTLPINK